MPKSIVFCADGTWNAPGQIEKGEVLGSPTNVYKMFINLDGDLSKDDINLRDEQEKTLLGEDTKPCQIAKYIHGVGDSNNILVKLLGGAVGAGVIARIVRGYTYISRNYEPGDTIFLVGFSRGAYTARALAGLIANKGLIDAHAVDLTDKGRAYRLASSVWYNYRRSKASPATNWLSSLEQTVTDLPGFFRQAEPPLVPNVEIEAVAVWDTVGALGIPQYAQQDFPVDAFRFADNDLNPKVRHGIHFAALDEMRSDFSPTLWTPDAARIVQTIWPGAHADVGGGYPTTGGESGLSDASLLEMQSQLSTIGLRFMATPSFVLRPDALGSAHRPWLYSPFDYLKTSIRSSLKGMERSASLEARLLGGPVVPNPGTATEIYSPTNL